MSQTKKRRLAFLFTILAIILLISGYQFVSSLFNTSATNISFKDFTDNIYSYDFRVSYLDVGKADSELIQCGDTDILIDAGDIDTDNFVTSYLSQQGVDDLELVIVTHPDRDHIGQMADVINNFEIDEFMMPEVPEKAIPTSSTYTDMIEALQDNNIPITYPTAGETIRFNDIVIDILAPLKLANDTNGNSIVSKITYGNDKFLFMGDADTNEEQDILDASYDIDCDVLKVGHHGSKSSSSLNFLEAVSPQYSIISVAHDKNNLPKQETIDKLNNVDTNIYRTDINGTIIAASNGDGVTIRTEK